MPRRGQQGVTEPSNGSSQGTTPPNANESQAWDDLVANAQTENNSSPEGKGAKGAEGGGFWLQKGEEAYICLLAPHPYVFNGHAVTLRGFNGGKNRYETWACQKSVQNHCVICDSQSKAVKSATQKFAMPLVDSRGKFVYEDNGSGGSMDGKPVAKIWDCLLYTSPSPRDRG